MGGEDDVVLDLNRRVLALLRCEAALALDWFTRHLAVAGGAGTPPVPVRKGPAHRRVQSIPRTRR